MSGLNINNSRLQFKFSTISGTTPTIGPSTDFTDGTWIDTDLYVGEFFLNAADNNMWVRTLTGIVPITSGTTTVDISAFVNKTGDTMSGNLYLPALSASTISGNTIYSNHFEGNFYGDGSNLTGITATVFTGGTISGPVTFTDTVDFCSGDVTIDSLSSCGDAIDIFTNLNVVGAITATTYYGDGSNLSGIEAVWDGGIVTNETTFLSGVTFEAGATGTFYGDGSNLTGITGTGNYLPLSGGTMLDNAIIQFDNASQLKEGNYDFGGQGGISQICSVGYENNWQSGINHIFDNSGFIRESSHCFTTIPDNTFDSSLRFKVGSRWILDNGDIYICSDDSVGAAVWNLESSFTGYTYVTENTVAETFIIDAPVSIETKVISLPLDSSQIIGLFEDYININSNSPDTGYGCYTNWDKTQLQENATSTDGVISHQGHRVLSGSSHNIIFNNNTNPNQSTSNQTDSIIENIVTNGSNINTLKVDYVEMRLTALGPDGQTNYLTVNRDIIANYASLEAESNNYAYETLSPTQKNINIYDDTNAQSTYTLTQTSELSRIEDGTGNQSESNINASTAYLLNTGGEGVNTSVSVDQNYAEMKQDEGSSVTRLQVSNDGFYQSQVASTGIGKGVSKTIFTTLETTDNTPTTVVWPLSDLEVGTTTVGIKATVTGINSTEDKAYISELYGAVRMNGYAVTIFGGVDKLEKSEYTTATSTIDIDSLNAAIIVTGETGETIKWSVKYELIYAVL